MRSARLRREHRDAVRERAAPAPRAARRGVRVVRDERAAVDAARAEAVERGRRRRADGRLRGAERGRERWDERAERRRRARARGGEQDAQRLGVL